MFDYASEYSAARKQLSQWLGEGMIQRRETIIKGGLKESEEALNYLFKGKNIGRFLERVDFYTHCSNQEHSREAHG